MKAYWAEDTCRAIATVNDLSAVISDVQGLNAPTMLFLEHDNGSVLVLGLGAIESVLAYVDEHGSSYHSVGNTERSGILKFWCREQLDDFMAEMAVPEPIAIDAAQEFHRSGTRPSNLEWEADW